MSASNEWVEWHLTSLGWKKGSCKLDSCDRVTVEPPKDRVLTCEYKTYQASIFSKQETFVTEIWNCGGKEKVEEFLKKFGGCPDRYYE
jgi:hypothetical protein